MANIHLINLLGISIETNITSVIIIALLALISIGCLVYACIFRERFILVSLRNEDKASIQELKEGSYNNFKVFRYYCISSIVIQLIFSIITLLVLDSPYSYLLIITHLICYQTSNLYFENRFKKILKTVTETVKEEEERFSDK